MIEINGKTLEYIEDGHIYLLDGVIIPSVTQVLQEKFGGMYSRVAPDVLKKASEHGTKVHKVIEDYCTRGLDSDLEELKDFKFYQKKFAFKVIANELPIIINPYCAGRLDLVFMMNGKRCLADIKTTSNYEKEYVGYQLNLYKQGYEETYAEKIDELYCIHIRHYNNTNFRHFRKVGISDIPYKWLCERN